jgi:hypothetical protein
MIAKEGIEDKEVDDHANGRIGSSLHLNAFLPSQTSGFICLNELSYCLTARAPPRALGRLALPITTSARHSDHSKQCIESVGLTATLSMLPGDWSKPHLLGPYN